MSYHLKLIKGRSYTGFYGAVKATRKAPDAFVDDKATADAAVASGYFKLVEGNDEQGMVTGHLDRAQLESMKLDDLKQLAADLGLDTKGLSKKAEFVEAIAATQVEAPAPTSIEETLAAMTDEELTAFANENDIDLSGCDTREDKLEAISVAQGGSYTMLDLMCQ